MPDFFLLPLEQIALQAAAPKFKRATPFSKGTLVIVTPQIAVINDQYKGSVASAQAIAQLMVNFKAPFAQLVLVVENNESPVHPLIFAALQHHTKSYIVDHLPPDLGPEIHVVGFFSSPFALSVLRALKRQKTHIIHLENDLMSVYGIHQKNIMEKIGVNRVVHVFYKRPDGIFSDDPTPQFPGLSAVETLLVLLGDRIDHICVIDVAYQDSETTAFMCTTEEQLGSTALPTSSTVFWDTIRAFAKWEETAARNEIIRIFHRLNEKARNPTGNVHLELDMPDHCKPYKKTITLDLMDILKGNLAYCIDKEEGLNTTLRCLYAEQGGKAITFTEGP
jgi:hypothetical protein